MEKSVHSAIDGFSNLPEHIIHQIMSLLPTKDATHMSILSKTFLSLWRSFPIVDLDCNLFGDLNRWRGRGEESQSFFGFVENSIENRMPNTCLQKLRLNVDTVDDSYSDLDKARIINRVIYFSLENNVRELDIDFGLVWKKKYSLEPPIFDAKSIKILTLKCFKTMSLDLVFRSSCLENLCLIGCCGFKTITLASNAKLLKALKIVNCKDLNYIHFESTAVCLESFSCRRSCFSWGNIKFNISCSTAPNLKHLQLIYQTLPERWVENSFSEFRYLETLKIDGCSASKKIIKFHLKYLKSLVLDPVDYNQVVIQAPNLVSFMCTSSLIDGPPEIDISGSSSTNLKHLRFHGQYVPVIWVKHNFSQFLSLETLELHRCRFTWMNIKFRLDYLRSLKLVSCTELSKVEIECPNLASFTYEDGGNVIYAPQVIITSKAKLDVELDFTYSRLDVEYCFSLKNFLECFAQHCQTLTLRCKIIDDDGDKVEEWIHALNELRHILVHPFYNLNHLKVQLKGLKYPTVVLDSLLRLAPHPNIISFVVGSRVESLKFHYKNENEESWVQDLKQVTLENFGDYEKFRLVNYFKSQFCCEDEEERVIFF